MIALLSPWPPIYLLSFPFGNESANDPEASGNSSNTHTHNHSHGSAAIHSFIHLKAQMCRKYSACTWGCTCTALLVEPSAGRHGRETVCQDPAFGAFVWWQKGS